MNELRKYFKGNIITPMGRPYILVVGTEDNSDLSCEKYIFYEKLNNSIEYWGEIINAPNLKDKLNGIENFIDNYGVEHCKDKIWLKTYSEMNEKTRDLRLINIDLRNVSEVSFLSNLRDKDDSVLDWIFNSTKSQQLKGMIKFVTGININKTPFN
ncbi:hypothetical protein [Tenacibaculum aiptasiae]|uniref:hypothetical protein n=1 Tax=Tenacibaculum aiptasiae TaxID=426481 RepID=UPI003B58EB74